MFCEQHFQDKEIMYSTLDKPEPNFNDPLVAMPHDPKS